MTLERKTRGKKYNMRVSSVGKSQQRQLTVRFTPDEYEVIKNIAHDKGQSMSCYWSEVMYKHALKVEAKKNKN